MTSSVPKVSSKVCGLVSPSTLYQCPLCALCSAILKATPLTPATTKQAKIVETCGPVTLAPPDRWEEEFSSSEPLL
jgi:hypothetical protein